MDMFTFIDRAVTLRYFPDHPVEVTFYLGDALEEKLQEAVAHYDAPHTLEEDRENFLRFFGQETGEKLLAQGEPVDRLGLAELLGYTLRALREAQGEKLEALGKS